VAATVMATKTTVYASLAQVKRFAFKTLWTRNSIVPINKRCSARCCSANSGYA